jgi:hypothetical protein
LVKWADGSESWEPFDNLVDKSDDGEYIVLDAVMGYAKKMKLDIPERWK